MAERLTIDKAIAHAREVARENKYRAEHKSFHRNDKDEISACLQCAEEHEQLAEWLKELQHYKDLEEQGRLVILPDGMNLRKLLDILTEYSPGCPSDYNLINRCELSCFECWLAALKGAENDNL